MNLLGQSPEVLRTMSKNTAKMTVQSQEPVTKFDLNLISRILRESKCPHESLLSSYTRYRAMDAHSIFFDKISFGRYVYEIEI